MKNIFSYKSKLGREYKCKVIGLYDHFVDIQLLEEDDDSIFLKVSKSMISKD